MKAFVCCFFTLSLAWSEVRLTQYQKLNDFDQALDLIRHYYAPLNFKQELFNFDFEQRAHEYRDKVKTTQNNADFYYILAKFMAGFRDSHTAAWIPTDHLSHLGFHTDLIDGVVRVTNLINSELNIKIGDEVISLNDQTSEEVILELIPYLYQGSDQATLRVAAQKVSHRKGNRVPVPKGDVAVVFKDHQTNELYQLDLKWQVEGELLDNKMTEYRSRLIFHPGKLSHQRLSEKLDPKKTDLSYQCSQKSRIALPADAEVVESDLFTAYTYTVGNIRLGHLRIGHFDPPAKELVTWLKRYQDVLALWEEQTQGLVIDIDHNCGGDVDVMHRLLAFFFDHDITPLQFELMTTKNEYLSFKQWIEDFPVASIKRKTIAELSEQIKRDWMSGFRFTQKTSIDGSKLIKGLGVYSKPIIILIDEMAASSGDAFPILMKGYHRAKLLGTQTAGAGGHVEEMSRLHHSGITLSLTRSLFYKPNGQAAENNGAIPDYKYTHTLNDLLNKNIDYAHFFDQKMLELLGTSDGRRK